MIPDLNFNKKLFCPKFDPIWEAIFSSTLVQAMISSPFVKSMSPKVSIRSILVQGELKYQFTDMQSGKAMHLNLSPEECKKWLIEHLFQYKQAYFYTSKADYHVLMNKKGKMTTITKPASKSDISFSHNRTKNYLLNEGQPIPFLVELNVMNSSGKVLSSKYDKFRQINRFLEFIDDLMPYFKDQERVRIVDFGCGKAYLTFALYHYFKLIRKKEVEIIGLDLKEEVIQFCQDLSERLGYQKDLRFQVGSIENYETSNELDLVISLHACNTATDAALEKAIRWNVKAILCVPCCQHELYQQLVCPILSPLTRHGILKERFAALATDALRAELLEIHGYQTQVVEFIDLDHTQKNLLIRAVKRDFKKDWDEYLEMKQFLKAEPSLEKFL